MAAIKVGTPKAIDSNGGTFISCTVSGPDDFPDTLWVERTIPAETEISGNWALVALLYPAMHHGADLHVEAPCCAELLHNLRHDVQSILIGLNPALKRIEIHAPAAVQGPVAPPGAATGFSAGVDSFMTLALHGRRDVPEPFRARYLTVHNVGALSPYSEAEALYRKYLERVADFSRTVGCRPLGVNSNLDLFYRDVARSGKPFVANHTLRNVAAAMVCEDLFGSYLYSSAYPYRAIRVLPQYDIAYSDPLLLPLLQSGRQRFISAGASLTRLDKSRLVADFAPAHDLLDVCVAPAQTRMSGKPNCGKCWKCSRQLVSFDLLGVLDRFDAVFDLDAYRRDRTRRIADVLAKARAGSGMDQEVIALLMQSQGGLPRGVLLTHQQNRLRGRIRPAYRRLVRVAARIAQGPGKLVSLPVRPLKQG